MSEQSPQNTPETTPPEPENAQQHPEGSSPAQWGILVALTGLVIALDQLVKWQVSTRLDLGQSWEPIPALASLIKITHSYNTGAAFGMLPQASDLFLLLALVTIIAFIISYPKLPSHAWMSRVSIGLISGGALSNAIDRLFRDGRVIDYVHIQLTPTFSNISNLADHAITLGVILLLLDQWLAERRGAAEAQPAEAQSAEAENRLTNPVDQG